MRDFAARETFPSYPDSYTAASQAALSLLASPGREVNKDLPKHVFSQINTADECNINTYGSFKPYIKITKREKWFRVVRTDVKMMPSWERKTTKRNKNMTFRMIDIT